MTGPVFRWKALSHERAIQFEAAHAVAGAAELDDDPLSWFAQQAPP